MVTRRRHPEAVQEARRSSRVCPSLRSDAGSGQQPLLRASDQAANHWLRGAQQRKVLIEVHAQLKAKLGGGRRAEQRRVGPVPLDQIWQPGVGKALYVRPVIAGRRSLNIREAATTSVAPIWSASGCNSLSWTAVDLARSASGCSACGTPRARPAAEPTAPSTQATTTAVVIVELRRQRATSSARARCPARTSRGSTLPRLHVWDSQPHA